MYSKEQNLRQKVNNLQSKPTKSQHWEEIISLARTLVIFVGIAVLLRGSVVEAFKIPSSSMEPTLQIGDHILVNKLSYGLWYPLAKESVTMFSKPSRGDIVVFTRPDDPDTTDFDESDTNIIKRIIGVGGDTIYLKGMNLYVNGTPQEDEQAIWLLSGIKDFGPITVPQGKVLLMGDNRDHSKDSRFWNDPFLDETRIKGRAFIIYWSFYSLKRIFNILR